jgi:hypothetical protein
MGDLPALNPALVRKVWESMAHPSTRRVARKFRQSGSSISHQTVARWRNRGWRPLEREQHPLEVAREQLDDAVPLLTGDPMTTAKVLTEGSAEREEMEKLSDGQLLRQAAREAATAVIVVAHAFLRQPEAIIYKPAELGVLFRALASCARGVSAAFAQASNLKTAQPETDDATR